MPPSFKQCIDLFLIVLLLLIHRQFNAQVLPKPFLLHWTELDGLADNAINTLLKDRYGLIWIATANGLSYFDGAQFRSFRPNPADSLALWGSETMHLLESSDGKIWVSTDGGGLSIFDYSSQTFHSIQQDLDHPQQGLKENRVYFTHEDTSSQTFYIGYRAIGSGAGGISKLSKAGQVLEHQLEGIRDYANFNMKVTSIYQDQNNRSVFWLGGRSFFKWNEAKKTTKEFPNPAFRPNFNSVSKIYSLNDSTLIVGLFYKGIQLFNAQKEQWANFIYSGPIDCFTLTKDQTIWLANTNGVGRLNKMTQQVEYQLVLDAENSPFPKGTRVRELLADENGLWIGTNKGLFYWSSIFQQFPVNHLDLPNGKNAYVPSFVTTLKLNQYLFLDKNTGLIQTDSNLVVQKTIAGPPKARYEAAVKHQSNHFFVGGTKGLMQWIPAQDRLTAVPTPALAPIQLDSIEIWSLYFDDSQQKLWIGTRYQGLLRFNLKTKSLKQFKHRPGDSLSLCHDKYLFEIDKGPRGNLWICTDKGISILDPETERFVYLEPINKTLGNYITHCVESGPDQNIWIGTRDQGLFCFNWEQQSLQKFSIRDGLPYNGVNRLLSHQNKLWMSTREGLCEMQFPDEYIKNYTITKGLVYNNLYASKLQAFPSDKLLLTYSYSPLFSVVQPDQLLHSTTAPKILLQSFRSLKDNPAKTKYLFDTDSLTLNASENYFAIEFIGIHFLPEEDFQYFYKLEGYDAVWVDAGNSKNAIYSNLPGGNYTFKVKAVHPRQNIQSTSQLHIFLKTPWYKQWWFFLSLGLIFGSTLWLIYKNRIYQIRRETDFKQLLAETEIIALRAQINPHFIFNCLNSIKSYIIENEIQAGTLYVSRFARLIRMILNHSKEKQIPLTTELEVLKLYLWLERERLQQQFEFSIELVNLEEQASIKVPPMLLQPFVENAIWHGLMNKDEPGHIQIKIEKQEDILWMKVADDGVGRAYTQKKRQASNLQKKSMGIEITQKRLAQINTLYQIEATIDIKDWKPDLKNPGTIVTICLPIAKVS